MPKTVVVLCRGSRTPEHRVGAGQRHRVAADDVRFRQLEIGRGILPFGGLRRRATAQLGWGNAMRFLLTADEFGAEDAYRIGLVQRWSRRVSSSGPTIAQTIAEQAPRVGRRRWPMPASRGTSVSRPRVNTSKRCLARSGLRGRRRGAGASWSAGPRSSPASSTSPQPATPDRPRSHRLVHAELAGRVAHADPHLDRLPLAESETPALGGQYAHVADGPFVEDNTGTSPRHPRLQSPPGFCWVVAQPQFVPVVVGLLHELQVVVEPTRVPSSSTPIRRSPPPEVGQCRHCLGHDELGRSCRRAARCEGCSGRWTELQGAALPGCHELCRGWLGPTC